MTTQFPANQMTILKGKEIAHFLRRHSFLEFQQENFVPFNSRKIEVSLKKSKCRFL